MPAKECIDCFKTQSIHRQKNNNTPAKNNAPNETGQEETETSREEEASYFSRDEASPSQAQQMTARRCVPSVAGPRRRDSFPDEHVDGVSLGGHS